jgi:fibronectin type 3 domain-containing protein
VITDLAAVERGDKIVVTFSTPPRTLDSVAITRFSHIDLRLGPESQNPDADKSIEIEPPGPSDKEDPQPKPIAYSLDVADYTGQRIAVFVRTAVKKTGHFSGWSNKVVLEIVPPLEKPVIQAEGSGSGIVLTWPATAATQYQVLRQGPSDKQPVNIASVNDNHYTDISAGYDTDYHYVVIGKRSGAESLPSEPIAANFPDHYPPAVPAGLTAQIGPDAIDLAWQRNTEPDLQGYYLFRSVNNGPFQRLGALITLPTYTDHAVEHGKTYGYKITAIDKKGNESGQSSTVEVQFP